MNYFYRAAVQRPGIYFMGNMITMENRPRKLKKGIAEKGNIL